MNLDYWRKHEITEKCMEFLFQNYPILESNDQDVLNFVLKDCKRNLPLTYNYQLHFLSKHFRSEIFSESFIKEIDKITDPLIIHYASPVKPWHVDYYGMPYGRQWHSYKRKSLWKHTSDVWPKCNHIKLFVKRYILWPINIKKPDSIFIDNLTT